ncbi:uncharacterized protein V6R79_011863 [Siganus canaliculatus]
MDEQFLKDDNIKVKYNPGLADFKAVFWPMFWPRLKQTDKVVSGESDLRESLGHSVLSGSLTSPFRTDKKTITLPYDLLTASLLRYQPPLIQPLCPGGSALAALAAFVTGKKEVR